MVSSTGFWGLAVCFSGWSRMFGHLIVPFWCRFWGAKRETIIQSAYLGLEVSSYGPMQRSAKGVLLNTAIMDLPREGGVICHALCEKKTKGWGWGWNWKAVALVCVCCLVWIFWYVVLILAKPFRFEKSRRSFVFLVALS